MPSILSKLLWLDYSLKFNCYEMGHTWTPNCTEACLDMGLATLEESFKLYLPIFLFSQVLSKKFNLDDFYKTFHNVVRSSAFLSLNSYFAMFFFCTFRHLFGKFYYIVSCWPPSFLASILAIHIEKPSRRGPLALYTLNVASESIVNMLVAKKYIPRIPNFEVLIFTLSISLQFYLMKKNNYSNDLFSSLTKLIFGESEIQSLSYKEINKYRFDLEQNQLNLKNNFLSSFLNNRHRSCLHSKSCFTYVLEGFFKPFCIATGVHVFSKTILKPQKLLSDYSIVFKELKNPENLKFSCFVGLFSSVFKLTNCILRRKSDGRQDWHCLVSALISGPFFYLSPSNSIALYVMWKALESCYNEALKSNLIEHKKIYPSLLYSFATAHLFYVAIVEPEFMKPSYNKFINRVSHEKINLFNRQLFKGFFDQNNQSCEKDFVEPKNLISKHISNYFQENVSSWLI